VERANRLAGLYAVTPDLTANEVHPFSHLLEKVERCVQCGVALIQYRNKSSDQLSRRDQAHALLKVCRQYGAVFIINDDVKLAGEIEADGVHIGCRDTSLLEARAQLGSKAIIGVSCYNNLDLAQAAERGGADYVAFGSFFTSRTKPNSKAANIELLHQAKRIISIPVVAIGGIGPDNAAGLIAAGADMIAVVEALFGQPDICMAAHQLADCFNLR
jgi:thiamine-phosphate pyrophosphorylase